jgi:hypothetical protein
MKLITTFVLTLLVSMSVIAQCPLVSGKFDVRPRAVSPSVDLYKNVEALPTMTDRKNYVSGLSPDGKVAVWRSHFDTIIGSKALNLDQLSVVMAIRNGLTSEVFATRTLTPDLARAVEDAKNVFTKAERNQILMKLGGEYVPSLRDTCDCRPSVSACDICAVLHPVYGCNRTDGGCGPIWLWDCTGMCAD